MIQQYNLPQNTMSAYRGICGHIRAYLKAIENVTICHGLTGMGAASVQRSERRRILQRFNHGDRYRPQNAQKCPYIPLQAGRGIIYHIGHNGAQRGAQ